VVALAGTEGQIAAEEARLVARIAAGDTGAPAAELYRRRPACRRGCWPPYGRRARPGGRPDDRARPL